MRFMLITAGLLGISNISLADDKWSFTLEGGVIYQTVNVVEIPPGTGTRFSLVDSLGSGPIPYFRAEMNYAINERHRIRLLAAPLSVEATAQTNQSINYNNVTFSSNTDTTFLYQFNSYRLTYAWRFLSNPRWNGDFGITFKIRQADIALKQGSLESNFPDLGFVPLLHFAAQWKFDNKWNIQSDLDAIASQYGRAFDFGLFVHYRINPNWSVGAGYRTVEGGADVDIVYNFAWLHYAGLRVKAYY
ncbi:MAG: hypothetical protein OEZ43_15625 [Gammaproteobacteria bacterium]|nr:hypothetical protein [Gammaproteobacteria bacterium]